MPDVVIVKEGEQDAVPVVLSRFSWSFLPCAEPLKEEVERKAPNHCCEEDTHQGQALDSLSTAQLHDDVEGKIQQKVADSNG